MIDSDQAKSATRAGERDGFENLVTEVSMGRAGIVLGLEVARLARNSSDWHRLLEISALTDTLILDSDGLYDLRHLLLRPTHRYRTLPKLILTPPTFLVFYHLVRARLADVDVGFSIQVSRRHLSGLLNSHCSVPFNEAGRGTPSGRSRPAPE